MKEMKTFLVAWLGTLVFCGLFLALFRGSGGGIALLLLPVTLIAAVITVFTDLSKTVEELRGRVQALEEERLRGTQETPAELETPGD